MSPLGVVSFVVFGFFTENITHTNSLPLKGASGRSPSSRIPPRRAKASERKAWCRFP